MQSAFSGARSGSTATSNAAADEFYGLRGLNLRDPDEEMLAGETPYTINSRMYARNDGESQVSNRTRLGASHFSDVAGATANVSNVATNTGDLAFSTEITIAQPFTPTVSGPLTELAVDLKEIGAAGGHVIVELYTDLAGVPSLTMIGQSAIYNSSIATTYQFINCYFMDAPIVSSGTQYWIIVYIQDNGSGNYYLNQTAAPGAMRTIGTAGAWSSLGVSFHYKTYISTSGGVIGYTARYPQDSSKNAVLFAQNGKLLSTSIGTPTITTVDSTVNTSAVALRFDQSGDKTIYTDGFSYAKQYDGTTVSNIPNAPTTNPNNILCWQNRVFLMTGNRVDFSELGDMTTWPSTNFFYIPITTPLAADHPSAWKIFQNNMVVWTHITKYLVVGSNISNFTYKEVVGTKGAVSQEAVAADRNFCYFMAPDKQIYRWAGSGSDDQLLSDKVQPILQGIVDPTKVRMNVYRNQLRVYFPTSPSATNDTTLIYDIELQEWFMDTDHQVAGAADLYLDKGDPLVEFSSVVGAVYYGETQYSDLGKMIDWKYWTNYKTYGYRRRNGQTFGGASAKKRIKRFRPIIRTADADYTMLVGKDMDFANNPDMREYIVASGGAKWGQFVWGDGTKFGKTRSVQNAAGMSGRGFHIQFRLERKGVETPVELYGYVALYRMGTQK